jgi:molybdopterin molybdotransferase
MEGPHLSGLLSLEEAQAKLLSLAPQTYANSLPLGSVPPPPNRWLSEDHIAARTQPAADLSAMDGYAICGEGPWRKVGESKAGTPFEGTLEPGQCTRISTGAHMPDGAESVLIQENAEVEGTRVAALEIPDHGKHVRRAGFDFAKGETVLRKGTKLTPAALALAISAGLDALSVVEPPAVAVLDSGDELVPAGIPCAPHQIPASNGAMLIAMLAPYVGLTEMLGPVPDDPDKLAEAFVAGEDNHILITSGGASVGDHDLVRPTLERLGARIDFWKVAMKPGKPLMVATREVDWGRQVILGLPGNPVSSFVTGFLFALPLIRKCMGARNPLPTTVPMIASEDLPVTGARQEFLRGIRSGGTVSLASSQDSSALKALAMADCLINRPAHSPAAKKGDTVEVYLL